MSVRLSIIACLLFTYSVQAQDTATFFFATRQCRDSVTNKLRTTIEEVIRLPLTDSTAREWNGACWAMELMLYRPAKLQELVPGHLRTLPELETSLQRSYLEMIYTLYPGRFNKQMQQLLPLLKNEKVRAMAWEYLFLMEPGADYEKDTAFRKSVYFEPFRYQRNKPLVKQPRINDFTKKSFLPGQTVLCSFQAADRNKPGYLMIRTEEGKWMCDEKGTPLRFPQLARSITNLPFYLTNGNTPQGLYKITGTAVSVNPWIGPTFNLQMELPFETGTATFFSNDSSYLDFYKGLLGSPLEAYDGLYESFIAGKLGRSEIIAHGTTIDPGFYRNKPYYPNTPSLGCLCSPETWNDQGKRISSTQADWMTLYLELKNKPQYLIVAEIHMD